MITESSHIQIGKETLHRIVMHPDKDVEAHSACIFTHGQGDYAERYKSVLHPFTDRGIRCIVTDLQGHGRSSGKRGHIASSHFIDSVIESNLKATSGLPTGIAGHSMGGLLTLRHLALSVNNSLPLPEFCWVNAPLLHPRGNRPDWYVRMVTLLASIAPSTTIHTGVTPEMCRLEDGARLPKDPMSLGHQRVSIGWGSNLLRIEQFTHKTLKQKSFPNPFLFTQGGADAVCPSNEAENFYEELNFPNKQFHLFPDMRHETFTEASREELFQVIGAWLDLNALNQ
ncbi:alpha/beta fold hydrolase [Rubritalea sp.]|uniref:alpha/beta fold hydrolase n=1 Tax=Rubritalea sp. TaxID=2109375 RepID=UPI003EF1318A